MTNKWFRGKTDRLPIAEGSKDDGSHRMTPFAQGYHDSFQLEMYDNPFTKSDEADWWCEYVLGFDYGNRRRETRREIIRKMWS